MIDEKISKLNEIYGSISRGKFNSDHQASVVGLIHGMNEVSKDIILVENIGPSVAVIISVKSNDQNSLKFNIQFDSKDEIIGQLEFIEYFVMIGDKKNKIVLFGNEYYLGLGNIDQKTAQMKFVFPHTRISDKDNLKILTYFHLQHSSVNNWPLHVNAGILCTYCYRILETIYPESRLVVDFDAHSNDIARAIAFCDEMIPKLKSSLIDPAVNLRWFISLILVKSYICFITGDRKSTLESLEIGLETVHYIKYWPSLVTNYMKLIYLYGMIRYIDGDPRCIEIWGQALPLLRSGCGLWGFENYWSFTELSVSVLYCREINELIKIRSSEISDVKFVSSRDVQDQMWRHFFGYPIVQFIDTKLLPNMFR